MENQRLDELIEKYILKTASTEEQQELLNWYYAQNDHEIIWSSDQLNEEALVKRRLLANINERIQPKVKTISLWPRIAAVAAAVAMVVFGVWFFNYRGEILRDALDDKSVVVNDIAPGKNGATITLGNGKVIQLSDAKSGVVIGDDKLAYNDGSEIDNSSLSRSDISPRGGESSAVAKTAKGQTYIFTLPDGTKVWLNAASTLTIPSDFSGTETRKVELTGEAYFEVAKNKKRPFIVESNGQEVTVLGTHFNINSYADEGSVRTTLLEGSVRVATLSPSGGEMPNGQRGGKTPNSSLSRSDISPQGGESSIVLKPNQQSVVSGTNRISVKEVDPESAVAWKNGDFNFKEEDLQTAMLKVARWYDVEVIYDKTAPKDLELGGWVSRKRNISAVLKMIESTGKVHFKVEGRRILVTK